MVLQRLSSNLPMQRQSDYRTSSEPTLGESMQSDPDGTLIRIGEALAQEPDDIELQNLFCAALLIDARRLYWHDRRDDTYLCISIEGLNHARERLKQAVAVGAPDPSMQTEIAALRSQIEDVEKRAYASSTLALVLISILWTPIGGVLWWLANRRPGHLLNRDYMEKVRKGKDPGKIGGAEGAVLASGDYLGEWGGLIAIGILVFFAPILAVVAAVKNYANRS